MEQHMPTAKDAVKYAEDVVSGKIISNKYVIKTCQNFLDEINIRQHQEDFRWTYDEAKANHIIQFYNACITHTKGSLAGKPYLVAPHEAFTLAQLYGWVKKEDQTERRYRNLVLQVARKNSKSTLTAGLAIYTMLMEPEGQECYSVATMKDQAKIVYDNTAQMIKKIAADTERDNFMNANEAKKYGIIDMVLDTRTDSDGES